MELLLIVKHIPAYDLGCNAVIPTLHTIQIIIYTFHYRL